MIADLIKQSPIEQSSARREIYANIAEQLAGLSDDELAEVEPRILFVISFVKAEWVAK